MESHADGGGGGGGGVGVLAEGTVGRMAVEPVRAGEAGDVPGLERLGRCDGCWCGREIDTFVTFFFKKIIPISLIHPLTQPEKKHQKART